MLRGLNNEFQIMDRKEQISDIDSLVVKYLTGEATEEDRHLVLTWIKESPRNRKYFDELKEILKAAKLAQPDGYYDSDASWERIKLRHYKELAERLADLDRSKKNALIRTLIRYAAVILLFITIGIIGYRHIMATIETTPKEVWNTVEAPYGSRVKMVLSDGSMVWLNAGSNLKYSSDFGKKDRKVFLDGEAYFKVEHDTSKQFIVSTSHLDVKVYGTEFDVKAYSDEDVIQTTLVSGSIVLEGKIVSRMGKRSVELKPNETATYYISDRKQPEKIPDMKVLPSATVPVAKDLIIIAEINPAIYTSWKDPIWYIEREPLSSLADKFERRFNVKFVFTSEALKNYKFTGTLKDETLEQVLNLMRFSAPINYKIVDNRVVLSENKYFKNAYDEMLIKNK